MFRKFCIMFLFGAMNICWGAAAANAGTVFDNLGTTYQGSFPSYGSDSGTFFSQANNMYAGEFTTSNSVSVTEIDLQIASVVSHL